MAEKREWEANHRCPVCGRFTFEFENDLDMCDVCGWSNDAIQEADPDYKGGGNEMSLNEAREAYAKGLPVF